MWDLFWSNIDKEIQLIKNAPIFAAAALVVAIALVWIASRWRYGGTIELLKEHISFLKDRIDHAVSEKAVQKIAVPLRNEKTQSSMDRTTSRKDEIDRIMAILKTVDFERSQLIAEDFLGSPLFGPSKGEILIKKHKDLIAQLEKLGHPFP